MREILYARNGNGDRNMKYNRMNIDFAHDMRGRVRKLYCNVTIPSLLQVVTRNLLYVAEIFHFDHVESNIKYKMVVFREIFGRALLYFIKNITLCARGL